MEVTVFQASFLHLSPTVSSLAPQLFNHSGSSLGHEKLARKRFIPQYPTNILTGILTEASPVIQALHSAWWSQMRCTSV